MDDGNSAVLTSNVLPVRGAQQRWESMWGVSGILIVDDEAVIRILLEETLQDLEDKGIELLFASDGAEGWALIQERRPRIVFLDVMMPKMDGYEVCQRVKGDPELSDTYVIMLTARGQDIDRQQGQEVGADEYVTKPFDPDYVIDRAQAVLDMSP
jgi:two-component system alkaline phosphatase synthesis response regulator PhoP